MIYLGLSILTNAALGLILKSFGKYNISLFPALVFNYITACSFGFIKNYSDGNLSRIAQAPWLLIALGMGAFFISLFFLIGLSTQRNGVASTAVANKMSLVIPVVFAIVFFKEPTDLLKILGILIAPVAVYLATAKEEKAESTGASRVLIIILIFIGSGLLDTSINYVQKTFFVNESNGLFLSTAFGSAACIGICIYLAMLIKGNLKWEWNYVFGGIFLGVMNYFSIHFLMLAIMQNNISTAVLFPVNNIGIVTISALAAYIFFKEHLTMKNKLGILLSLAVIVIILVS